MSKTFVDRFWPDIGNSAVAYQLNFVYMCYGYGSERHSTYFKPCCEHNESISIHYRDFEYPKSSIKKPYVQLDWGYYAVGEALKNAIVKFGIDDAEEDVFRAIWTRKHDRPIAYSIEPKHVLKPIYRENDYCVVEICKEHDVYWAHISKKNENSESKYELGDPIYVSREVLEDMHDFNYTYEYFGPGGYLLRDVIVSKRVYEFIISLYPRAEFRPVVIKEN